MLARVQRWNPTREEEESLKAQLLRLGAQLAVLACDRGVLLEPGAPAHCALIERRLPAVRGIAVRLLDGLGHTRWQRRDEQSFGSAPAALVAALEEAATCCGVSAAV